MSDPANRLPPEYDETLPADYDPQFTADISTAMRVPDRIAVASDEEDEDTGKGAGEGYHAYRNREELHRAMNIPDKIVMMGDDEPQGVRDPRLNLHLDFLNSVPSSHDYVGLDTPPRVLTLEDRPFPPPHQRYHGAGDQGDEDEEEEMLQIHKDKNMTMLRNGYVNRTPARQHHTSLTSNLPIPQSVNNLVNIPLMDNIAKWFGSDQQSPRRFSEEAAALLATPGEGLLIENDQDDDLTQLKRQVAKLHRHVNRLEQESSSRKLRELFLYPLVAGYILLQFVKFLK